MRLHGTSIRLPAEIVKALDEMRKKENRSRSNLIVELVKEALAERARKDAYLEAHRE